jgi:hypothetical protein
MLSLDRPSEHSLRALQSWTAQIYRPGSELFTGVDRDDFRLITSEHGALNRYLADLSQRPNLQPFIRFGLVSTVSLSRPFELLGSCL